MHRLDYTEIKGNWATLLLATDEKGRLDIARLTDEIDVLIASKPCGIYSNGTAGEFYTQDEKEFTQISELLSERCEKARVPYQIGVSHPCPQASLRRLQLIRDLRPGAVQLILPDWFPPSDYEVLTFMETMEKEADGIPLILYNPPHAKRILKPEEWMKIKDRIPSFMGVKVSDNGADPQWYEEVRRIVKGLSIFIPGHHLATGISSGCHGAYSNVAALNPFGAQKWYEMMIVDMPAALELEARIQAFMDECITPFITEKGYANHACDRFMAMVGNWSEVGGYLRWPYRSIPLEYVKPVRARGHELIPELINDTL